MKPFSICLFLIFAINTTKAQPNCANICNIDNTILGVMSHNFGEYDDHVLSTTDTIPLDLNMWLQMNTTACVNVPDSMISYSVDIESFTIDSITGLPPGVSITAYSPINQEGEGISDSDFIFNDNTTGCIKLSAIPTAPLGTYPIKFWVKTQGSLNLPTTIPSPLFNYQYIVLLHYTPCIGTEGNTTNLWASATPNPTTGMTTIEFGSKIESSLTFSVVNTLGEIVHNETIQANKGVNNIRFDASNLATGVYFYSISNGVEKTTKRLAVVKM